MNVSQRWIIALSPDGAARAVAEKTASAFREILGPDSCMVFDPRPYREGYKKLLRQPDETMVADLINQSLAVSCFDFGATHCLVCALCPVTLFTLNLFRKRGIVTLHWFYEDFRRAAYWQEVLPGYNHFCAIQRGPLPSACESAHSRFHLLPTAGLSPDAVPEPENRCFDVSFVGIPSPYRIEVLEALASTGMSIACGGEGWDGYRGILQAGIFSGRWISAEESFKQLTRSKIGINLSFAEPWDRENVHISPRAYDILKAGALLLTEESPLAAESLVGCSFKTFRNIPEALAIARALLARYSCMEPLIAQNSRAVRAGHTYKSRVTDILSYVN